ncbi:MAG TPA: DUF3105 domain-containing protein [Anaerolineales bacterium]
MEKRVKSSKANLRKAQLKRRRLISRLTWGGAGALAVVLIGFFVWTATQSNRNQLAGVEIPVTSQDHVPITTPPGPFNSDPPAGGKHYNQTLPAKFYQDADLAALPQHPEGYLVHDLEHGYVIFWYNCQIQSASDCTSLKNNIQTVMDEFNGLKVVAFPWKSLDVPLVMTSWGRELRFKSADLGQMRNFVEKNRNQSPEPNAQ